MAKFIDRPFEIKSIKDNGQFTGVASPFGELDSYRDIVVKGAFTNTLRDFEQKNRKVPMLWQHSSREPIGVYTDLKETDTELVVTGECNMDVQKGRECFALMKQGALTGLSIGYNTVREEWDAKGEVRKLLEVDLWEISPVTFPSADSARVLDVKAISELETLADLEKCLRDASTLSKSEVLAFIARVKAVALRSESAVVPQAELQKAMDKLKHINSTL